MMWPYCLISKNSENLKSLQSVEFWILNFETKWCKIPNVESFYIKISETNWKVATFLVYFVIVISILEVIFRVIYSLLSQWYQLIALNRLFIQWQYISMLYLQLLLLVIEIIIKIVKLSRNLYKMDWNRGLHIYTNF